MSQTPGAVSFETITSLKSLALVENILKKSNSHGLATTCLALYAIQQNFLGSTSYTSLEEYVRGKASLLGFTLSADSATRHAKAATVFQDLWSYPILPTVFDHLKALTPLSSEARKDVWGIALESGEPITLASLKVIASGRDRLRRAPTRPTQSDKHTAVDVPVATSTSLVFLNSKNCRWGTPSDLVLSVREVLTSIDLDPFSESLFNKTVRARVIFTKAMNGFNREWVGRVGRRVLHRGQTRVFMNPPAGTYRGRSQMGMALKKAIREYRRGTIHSCIALVKAAVGYEWYQQVYGFHVCQMYRRPSFVPPSGVSGAPSPHGYAVVYI